ncbi:hypothetical protein J7T55_007337 [Diaporthe amygdali]|uniref:uncharacterized protein n=1 Tax=Phomopsis amygdali TaxID=1214568 RepID=UPI0022FE910C|nr:uncharacterized protein J7T55_007337 [Diaporthe amygdali]KAJ0116357.1 hypothetical protein J7T55_007337 [Diaporthe amygdali]
MRWTDFLSIRGIFDDALCSDPRDRIYGIRSLLLEDQQELCGEPNYTRSTVEVYSEFTRNYIKRYPNGLTILRQCELSQLSQRWSGPSWVPDWSTKAGFQSRHGTFASSQLQGHFAFPRTGTLQVLGISQTVVKEIQPVPKFYQRDWNEAVKFLRRITPPQSETTVYPPGGSLLRALARTMVCGAVSDFGHVRDGNFPATQIAEAEMSRFVSGVDLVSEDYKIGSHAQRFLKRMDWGSGGKSFIISTGGYVGVSPPSTRIGDEIFVIVGCQQPLVLRRCLNGANQYSVVGVCYVEGCARGEPLLGNLPDHIGFSWIEDTVRLGWSRRFENLWSGELFQEDPRLESLGVVLGEFRKRLSENPEATLNLAPEVLQKCIAGLQYIELI